MLVTQLLQSGILVAEDRQWRNGDKTDFSGELAEIIDERLKRVTVLDSREMRLFGWKNAEVPGLDSEEADACKPFCNLNFGPVG